MPPSSTRSLFGLPHPPTKIVKFSNVRPFRGRFEAKPQQKNFWLQLLADKLLAKQIEEGAIVLVARVILFALM